MSAKAFYHKSTPAVPSLKEVPPEVWSTIIRYTADSGSGLYDHEMTPSEESDFIRGEDTSQMHVFHEIFHTRSYLARVSKAWYEMAVPFLFEYICLVDGRRLNHLYKALLRSTESAASNGSKCPLGWWTKRLDLGFREPNPRAELTAAQLANLVSCFPNLRILTFSATGHGYDSLRTSLILDALSCPKSLKAIHWHTMSFWPFTDAWTAFLERHPGLQSIRGPRVVNAENQIELNSLKALYPYAPPMYASDIMELAACHLPSLRCFNFPDNTPPSHEFLKRVGKQLSVVQVHSASFYMPRPAGFDENHGSIFSLDGEVYRNLSQIGYEIVLWSFFHDAHARILSFPNSLKTLGLMFKQPEVAGHVMEKLLLQAFPQVKSNNPSITTIRFLASKNVKALQRHPTLLKDGVQRLASLGVSLEDHNSRPLLDLQKIDQPVR